MNTPTKTAGVGAGRAADLTYWEGAARMIAAVSKTSKIIVEKSTVPVKTAEAIEKVRPSVYCAVSSEWNPCVWTSQDRFALFNLVVCLVVDTAFLPVLARPWSLMSRASSFHPGAAPQLLRSQGAL